MATQIGSSEDVSPKEAYEALARDAKAVLVDVRSRPEWTFVGIPDLEELGKEPLFIEWQAWPAMNVSANFLSALAAGLADKGADAKIYFLCRSGARSGAAAQAAAEAGLGECYNVAGGFEGRLDADGRRGSLEGWKADGLPWRQS